jgi:hypothetical protein
VTAQPIRQAGGTHPADDKHHRPGSGRGRARLDWLNGTDPGLMRLEMAAEMVLAIRVVLVALERPAGVLP